MVSVQQQYLDGAITNGERYNKVIEIWSAITEKVADEMFAPCSSDDKEGDINPIYVMADSGARGSKQQIRQLSGMRGLMAKPSGEIIETPDHGQLPRRPDGVAVLHLDARRSQGSGRYGAEDGRLRLPDPPPGGRGAGRHHQRVRLRHGGRHLRRSIVEAGEIIEPLRDRIVGRVSLEKIKDYEGNVIVDINQEITEDLAGAIQAAGIERVKIRSVLTCESKRGVCVLCYGRNLASGRMVELGEAIGVIAAQSIGEPGTQLTMRTFHIGGTASRVSRAVAPRCQEQRHRALHQPADRQRQVGRPGGDEPPGFDRRCRRQGPREGALLRWCTAPSSRWKKATRSSSAR